MALTILPRQDPYWGSALSGLLGNVGQAAGQIGTAYYGAKSKKREKEEESEKKQQQAQAFNSIFPWLTPEQSSALASAPEKIQQSLVQNMLEQGPPKGWNRSSSMNGMEALAGLGGQPGQQEMQPQMNQAPQLPRNPIQDMYEPGAFLTNRLMANENAPKAPTMQKAPEEPTNLFATLDKDIKQAIKQYDIDEGIGGESNYTGLVRSGLSKAEANQAIKDTAEFYKEIKKEQKGAKEDELRLKRMEKLIDENIQSGGKKLRGPLSENLLNVAEDWKTSAATSGLGTALGALAGQVLLPVPGVGAAAGAALGAAVGGVAPRAIAAGVRANATEEQQELEKISADFIKGAKVYFGARLTDNDLIAFMKTIPNSSQSDAGKSRVIRNLRLLNQGRIIQGNIADQIIKENDGRRPHNLQQMVEAISEPIMNKIAEEFVNGTKEILSQADNKKQSSSQVRQQPRQNLNQGSNRISRSKPVQSSPSGEYDYNEV